jgi:DDE superfamily endonuclease
MGRRMDTTSRFQHGCAPCPAPHRRIVLSFPTTFLIKLDSSRVVALFGSSFANGPNLSFSFMSNRHFPMSRLASKWTCIPTQFATGGDVGQPAILLCRTRQGAGPNPAFPPLDEAIVKAIACELVCRTERPLSRQSLADLTTQARQELGKSISRSTVWRMLHTDAIKPWQYEYWIYPRDPRFAVKAEPILDLYAGTWQGKPLGRTDCIISADEKTSIQARVRCHPTVGPAPGRKRRVEFEYDRGGALQYLAAWDVRRGIVMGRCEPSTGIEPFGRLVAQVMGHKTYRSAKRVFWVVDNGSSHRGQAAVRRLAKAHPNLILLHTPVHASWLNQVEIYFSLVQRKVLTPNDFADLADVERRLLLYQELSNRNPRPFNWRFDREKLAQFLQRVEARRTAANQTLGRAG